MSDKMRAINLEKFPEVAADIAEKLDGADFVILARGDATVGAIVPPCDAERLVRSLFLEQVNPNAMMDRFGFEHAKEFSKKSGFTQTVIFGFGRGAASVFGFGTTPELMAQAKEFADVAKDAIIKHRLMTRMQFWRSEEGRMDDRVYKNTDRTLWRETPDDFYAPSIHVTEAGGIGICVGGTVIVRTLREWHELVAQVKDAATILQNIADEACIGECSGAKGEYYGFCDCASKIAWRFLKQFRVETQR